MNPRDVFAPNFLYDQLAGARRALALGRRFTGHAIRTARVKLVKESES